MHLRSSQMVQCNGFPNRLWELVRIFTASLMVERWRRHCIKVVGEDAIEGWYVGTHHASTGIRCYHGKSVQGIPWLLEKLLRDWLLTVGVRQNQKKHMLSLMLPNRVILCCPWQVLPHWGQCGLSAFSDGDRESFNPNMKQTKQRTTCDISVRHAACTASG